MNLKEKLKLVPHLPGSYQMKDKTGTIIYVGKAKDLHKRVSSYFNKEHTGKTAKLVSQIDDFEYIVTSSETESLVLELNLIKLYDPKYNILLKDDKSYPYIQYISKPYPKLKIVRYAHLKKKDSKNLFGPYPNAYAARKIVNLLNRLYPLKKCDTMPKKVCLYYHIEECLGYCQNNVNQEQINVMEDEILSFLRGNDKILKNKIFEKINVYSQNLNFEKALELKKELDSISLILDKQKVQLNDMVNRDIIAYYFNNDYISVQIFFLRNGKLLGHDNHIFQLISSVEEDVEYYIVNFYLKHEVPKEIIIDKTLNKDLLSDLIKTNILIALKGDKYKLLNMARTNAKIALENEFQNIKYQEQRTSLAQEELQKILNMDNLYRIDAFDNSNLFGSYSVSGMVVFKDGLPSKKDYRKYKVSVDKNDDYHTMQEVIYRRYTKVLEDDLELPDLIVVDGGINQINACLDSLDKLNLNIRVVGLKKDSKHRTNVLIDSIDYKQIPLDSMSNVFHFLTRIQDEVHRYTINYHKTIRSKGSIASILDNIAGIGTVRRKKLISKYGNINNLKSASVEELSTIIPKNVALELLKYLNEYNKSLKK